MKLPTLRPSESDKTGGIITAFIFALLLLVVFLVGLAEYRQGGGPWTH